MKRLFLIIAILFTAFAFYGCSTNNKLLLSDSRFEEEEINYEIEQILFSKSFQTVEPSVEIITNNNKLKILASLGLSEYSSVSINNIIKKGSEVNIHVNGSYDKSSRRLAVPQVIMELKKTEIKSIENLKFNIVYDDYKPLKIKYSINDVLNKLQSQFKIVTKNSPTFTLSKDGDNVIWDIQYNSIFDKDEPNSPLINLNAQINANTGDIITSKKEPLSIFLDNGRILNYINHNSIIYKKSIQDKESDKTSEQLWIYNISDEDKSMLYSSNLKILSAQLNPSSEYISILEENNDINELYIIPLLDKRAYKISFEDNFNPKIMRWNNDGILYLIDDSNTSTIYSYDVKDNDLTLVKKTNKNIDSLIIYEDYFLITEKNINDENKKISITDDWSKFRIIGSGLSPKFLNNNVISYLVASNYDDYNSLLIYDLVENDIIAKIGGDILSFETLPDNNIALIEKNSQQGDFSLLKYSLNQNSTEHISSFIGEKIFYDENNQTTYLNISLPFDNDKTEMIYAININKAD